MRHFAIAAIAMILLACSVPAHAGIRTDNGSLQNPNAITVLQTEASQPAPDAKAG